MAVEDMFLKIEGVTGESVDDDHVGHIKIDSFSWGIHGHLDAATNLPYGKASVQSLNIVKKVDAASPALLQYCYRNKVVRKGTLSARKAGGSTGPLEFITIVIGKLRVLKVDIDSSSTDITEHVSLTFDSIEFNYKQQGRLGSATSADLQFSIDSIATPG
jgi:type VI secretion system secreted protein Hcp